MDGYPMDATLKQELVQEFVDLLQCEGVRSVAQWQLPNHDVPFSEDEALTDFCDQLDGHFELTAQVMAGMSAPKK
jgi:hypothetical protein